MYWLIALIVLILLGYLLDREIYFYEGVRLGPRIQSLLYDRWSKKYDIGKRASQLNDDEMLAGPLLEKMRDIPEPFILDFATGTGRLSFALTNRDEFKGHIIALDISQGMLEKAAAKLSPKRDRVELIRQQSMPLPFPDASFDVVWCLEVLELLPDTHVALQEMARVLRPGGILLTSRGTEESGRKAKVKSRDELTAILHANTFEDVQITKWWKLFDRVFARKAGTAAPVSARSLSTVLMCSKCQQVSWMQPPDAWQCLNCKNEIKRTGDGILLN